jgi:hypothetical protein
MSQAIDFYRDAAGQDGLGRPLCDQHVFAVTGDKHG